MGLVHSGECSDYAFYKLCERDFATNSDSCVSHGAKFYSRFKDGIFVILTGGPGKSIRSFVDAMQLRSRVSKVKIESVNRQTVEFLNIRTCKGVGWHKSGLLGIEPYRKPSPLAVPLRSTSGHPDSVHKSWPLSRCCRFESISTSRSAYKRVLAGFIHDIETHDPNIPRCSA